MKKIFILCIFAVVSTLSLQSCVTNYVVSQPAAIYNDEYKTNAKLGLVDNQKIEESKKELINSFLSEKVAKIATVSNSLKNSEIAKDIKHNKIIDDILNEATTYLGTPYRYGGTTRNGIDCSAFVLSVFGAVVGGRNLPRVASSQAQEGEKIEKENLQKGDLLFFSHGGGRISHVAIVEEITAEGDIKFIHAATSKGVMISSLKDAYWAPKFRFAKRIIKENDDNLVVN